MKVSKSFERWSPLALLAIVLLLWQAIVAGLGIAEFIFPSPWQIAKQFIEFKGPLIEAAWKTFWVTMLGFGLSIAVGVLLGFLVGSSRLVYTALYPLLVAFNAVPKAAIVPILVVWFGIGLGPGILTAFLISFFPITVNIATGLATLEPELEDVLRVLGAKRWDVLVKVGLPRSMPYFYASLKVAITLAFVGTVLAEMTAGDVRVVLVDRAPHHRLGAPRVASRVSWQGRLALHYTRDGERTIAHDRHEGPLRVLQRLYPEGPAICHHVLVHPPGGIVGGDALQIEATLDAGTHALITTPGATRFYRSSGAEAAQRAVLRVADGARLEWLPLETIAYSGCLAENRVQLDLAAGAEGIGWDVLALGLPAADAGFAAGSFTQHLELPGRWLERGRIGAEDKRLLDSPLGLAGQRVMATAWFASGSPLAQPLRDALLDAARDSAAASPLAARCGVTSPHESVVVARVLAARVEPAMALLQQVRAAWRRCAWGLAPNPPRVWQT